MSSPASGTHPRRRLTLCMACPGPDDHGPCLGLRCDCFPEKPPFQLAPDKLPGRPRTGLPAEGSQQRYCHLAAARPGSSTGPPKGSSREPPRFLTPRFQTGAGGLGRPQQAPTQPGCAGDRAPVWAPRAHWKSGRGRRGCVRPSPALGLLSEGLRGWNRLLEPLARQELQGQAVFTAPQPAQRAACPRPHQRRAPQGRTVSLPGTRPGPALPSRQPLRLGVIWFLSEPRSPGLGGPTLPTARSKFKGSTRVAPEKFQSAPAHLLPLA